MKSISLENEGHLAPKILIKTLPKFIKRCIDFLIDFRMGFEAIVDATMPSKSHKKRDRF